MSQSMTVRSTPAARCSRLITRVLAAVIGLSLTLSSILPAVAAGKIATTTALSSSATTAMRGQSIALTATVTPVTATGTVTYKDGTTTIGTATLAGGIATFNTSALTVGSHNLTAVYGGSTGANAYAASTSPLFAQTINKFSSTTALTVSPNPSTRGQTVALTATITAYAPTGTVTFKDGSTTLGSSSVSGNTASLSTSTLAAGAHALSAVYGGDANNITSTSTAIASTVDKVVPVVQLSASSDFISSGTTVQLIATITGFSPSGSISFKDAAATIGSGVISAGQATFTATLAGAGFHGISASHPGNGDNSAATSNGRIVQVTEGKTTPAGLMTWRYGYDPEGKLGVIVDPKGRQTSRNMDALQRVTDVALPSATTGGAQPTISTGYDARDSVTSVKDPRNLTTSYTLNGLGDKTGQSSPDTGATSYTLDVAGNPATRTDSRNKTTTFAYDALNRPTSATYATGVATVFEYDGGPGGPATSAGRLSKISDESGTTTLTHDTLGRVVSKTQVVGSRTFTVVYDWGTNGPAAGKLVAMTYPSGSKVNYNYDTAGRLTAVSVNPVNANGVGFNALAPFALLSNLQYNGQNIGTGWIWSDASPYQRTFDAFGRPTSYPLGQPTGTGVAAGLLRSIGYDDAGFISTFTHSQGGVAAAAFDQSFGYDELDRVVSATVAGSAYGYTYDATGNRLIRAIGGTNYTNTIAATSNRLTQVQAPGSTSTIVHDATGNITADGAATYSYSDRGRLATATVAGNIVTYKYNGIEQRVSKTGPAVVVPTGAAYFVHDETGNLIGEYDASGAVAYETIYLGAAPIGLMKHAGSASTNTLAVQFHNIYADHLDTPRVITRAVDQAIVWRWDSAEPFGATSPNTNPNGLGAFVFNQRFAGQAYDAETGNFYNWHRDYQASNGRYTQSDPIGLAGGINTYAYVGGNSVSYVDPDGLNPALAVYRAGMTGYRIGEAINPYVQPYISSAVDALLLPDFNDPGIILAQNNKHTRKRIAGLQAHIDEHKKLLDKEPDCQASNHWRNEIAAAEAEIARLRLRLPNGR